MCACACVRAHVRMHVHVMHVHVRVRVCACEGVCVRARNEHTCFTQIVATYLHVRALCGTCAF